MNRFRSQLTVWLAAAICLLVTGLISKGLLAQTETGCPNILFIMTDQQHSGMLSCTGNDQLKTPALDRLARNGIRFERAYVANPVCMPSRTSMATGVMPGRLGVFNNGMKADVPEIVDANSLGKLMQRAGYDTFYGGKVHMCPELNPKDAGYEVMEKDSREVLPEACIEFLRRDRARPFFAVASFINPHDICFAHAAHIGKAPKTMQHVDQLYRQASELPLDQLPPVPANYAIPRDEPEAIGSHLSPKAVTPAGVMRGDYDQRQWQIYRWIYCRLTEMVDKQIGRILDAVRDEGLEKNTVILFTSDHGNMDASHRLASKGLFYEESVRVPLLMQYKGVIRPDQVDDQHLVSTGLDILPTLCDYAGAEVPDSLLGRSLRPIAEGKDAGPWRTFVVSENSWGRMIRSRTHKYCVYESGNPRESLIDMEADPLEMKNQANDSALQNQLKLHRQYLQQWIRESGDEEAKLLAVE